MAIHCPLYTYSSGLPTCDNLLHVGKGRKHVQFFSWGNLCLLAADFFGATLPPSPEHRRGASSSSSSSATGTTTTGRGSWKEGRGGPSLPLVCGKSSTCVQKGRGGGGGGARSMCQISAQSLAAAASAGLESHSSQRPRRVGLGSLELVCRRRRAPEEPPAACFSNPN